MPRRQRAHTGVGECGEWRRGALTAGARELDADGPVRPFLRSRCARIRKRTGPVAVPARRVVGGPCVPPTIQVCSRPHGVQVQERKDLALPLPLPARCSDELHFKRDCHISDPLF
ncbi:hypothetical protein PVAP13_1NG430819 [Panicum virgatum]|uniref:Uncharacterized protein n=1 Tax=Panicum virgatum TaxID=38727 RepID=A0A8T0XCJ0_PANVG|nr:hypothetical protein PVAP13_1NG430819 [Panicum virgatum]